MKNTKKIQGTKKLTTKSFEKLLKEVSTSETFIQTYNEELLRLKLSSQIKDLRTKKRLTQETFAKKANMPQSVIARVESGKHTISLITLDKIAHALGKKIELV